jgi:choline dehydrogenase-like flavoprotein
MFTLRYVTDVYAPDLRIVLRTAADGWEATDVPGVYTEGAWTFRLDERRYQPLLEFKFVLTPGAWMMGDNLRLVPADGATYDYRDDTVRFQPVPAVVTENAQVQRALFKRNLDQAHEYEVLVVGSGIGGGILADQLADLGADVLVLEAGSYLFPTHVANLPRRLRVGRFDKSVWGLFPDFSFANYVNVDGSAFAGRQAFNLGGRSVFWGGLIPRMGAWELGGWPAAVRDYLLTTGYRLAEDALNRVGPIGSTYQEDTKRFLTQTLPDFDHLDAPVAVQYQGYTPLSIPGGMFSTADLLLEDQLVEAPGGPRKPTVNLNHAVSKVLVDQGNPRRVAGVTAHDLLANEQRTFRARNVVLAAGTIESPKLALQSDLDDPNQRIGRGLTDHPILYTHFALPAGSPHAAAAASAKVWSRHRDTSADRHAYNVVLELGADFNQGRYVDPDNLARQRAEKGDQTLCEIVFLFNAPLVQGNFLQLAGPPAVPVRVNVQPYRPPDALRAEVAEVAATVLHGLGAEALVGEDLALREAALGGVAHEVGTLRMADDGTGVVDDNLRFLGYDNLYACDNSVFPSSPAANPTLTLTALGLRLAGHLTGSA